MNESENSTFIPEGSDETGNPKTDLIIKMTDVYLSMSPKEQEEYIDTIVKKFQDNGAPSDVIEAATEFVNKVRKNQLLN